MGVLGIGLALPFSVSARAGQQAGTGYADAYPVAVGESSVASIDSTSVLERWRNYALASITPRFSWSPRIAEEVFPRVTDSVAASFSAPVAFNHFATEAPQRLALAVANTTIADTPYAAPSLLHFPGLGLERTVVAPSFVQGWGDDGVIGVSAVLASQRYASIGMGEVAWREGIRPATWPGENDRSFGSGVRLDAGNALGENWNWSVSYQSRVNMDAFNTYRGVYSDPGDFDIPASASFDIGYALTPSLALDFGVQRVMYSAITPFTSAALPTRFLALLGDGASPVFAWRDLTVYSLGWTWRDETIGDVGLRYTTRQQPSPTSSLLEQALAADMAHDNLSLGWSRATGNRSRLSFLANYSSSPYFLGLPSYRLRNDARADQVEFEALWALRF